MICARPPSPTPPGPLFTRPVVRCQLARHVGGTHRWATERVRTRATGPVAHDLVDNVSSPGPETPAALETWIADGALRTGAPANPVRGKCLMYTGGAIGYTDHPTLHGQN
ncbi:hypothetical protein WJ438_36840 [Streptomyces sp. GD-15H]|uniref:hypothetical protein n=1 Tax=Streptomyces sp. GD-15H TaxID=3129112 RepID=UPI0032497464